MISQQQANTTMTEYEEIRLKLELEMEADQARRKQEQLMRNRRILFVLAIVMFLGTLALFYFCDNILVSLASLIFSSAVYERSTKDGIPFNI